MSRFQPITPNNTPTDGLGFTAPILRTQGVDRVRKNTDASRIIGSLSAAISAHNQRGKQKEREAQELSQEQKQMLNQAGEERLFDAKKVYDAASQAYLKGEADALDAPSLSALRVKQDEARRFLVSTSQDITDNVGYDIRLRENALKLSSGVLSSESERVLEERSILEAEAEQEALNDVDTILMESLTLLGTEEALAAISAGLEAEEVPDEGIFSTSRTRLIETTTEQLIDSGLTESQVDDILSNPTVSGLLDRRAYEHFNAVMGYRQAEADAVVKQETQKIEYSISESLAQAVTDVTHFNPQTVQQIRELAERRGLNSNDIIKSALIELQTDVSIGARMINPASLAVYDEIAINVPGAGAIIRDITNQSINRGRAILGGYSSAVEEQWLEMHLPMSDNLSFTQQILWDSYSADPGDKNAKQSIFSTIGLGEKAAQYDLTEAAAGLDAMVAEGQLTDDLLVGYSEASSALGLVKWNLIRNSDSRSKFTKDLSDAVLDPSSVAGFLTARSTVLTDSILREEVIASATESDRPLLKTLLYLDPQSNDFSSGDGGEYLNRVRKYVDSVSGINIPLTVKEDFNTARGFEAKTALPDEVKELFLVSLAAHNVTLDRQMTQADVDSFAEVFKSTMYYDRGTRQYEVLDVMSKDTVIIPPKDVHNNLKRVMSRSYDPDISNQKYPARDADGNQTLAYAPYRNEALAALEGSSLLKYAVKTTPRKQTSSTVFGGTFSEDRKRHVISREADGSGRVLNLNSNVNVKALVSAHLLTQDPVALASLRSAVTREAGIQGINATEADQLAQRVAFDVFRNELKDSTVSMSKDGGRVFYHIEVPVISSDDIEYTDFTINITEETYNRLIQQ